MQNTDSVEGTSPTGPHPFQPQLTSNVGDTANYVIMPLLQCQLPQNTQQCTTTVGWLVSVKTKSRSYNAMKTWNTNIKIHFKHSSIHIHTIVLLLFWNMSGTTRVSRYKKGKTRKVKTNLNLLEQEIVSGSGHCWAICKSAPHPRQPCQHPNTQFFLQAGCPSCHPTNRKENIAV